MSRYLTFHLTPQMYAIGISAVREILRLGVITPLPNAPRAVAGVMNLRGKVTPIVNLRAQLELGDSPESRNQACVVVIETVHGQVGVIVDSVNAVIEMTPEQIEPAPQIGHNHGYIAGIGKWDHQVIVLLDIERCVGEQVAKAG